MVAKILSSTGSFRAVKYNTSKIDKNKGELMAIKNFSHLTDVKNVSSEVVKNYLKTISGTNLKVKNPQFHCAISCKGREFDKNQLTNIAEKYIEKMGYSQQPYLVIFHNDTENNHVHIVSTRITKEGKKINDSYERYRSITAIKEIISKDYNIKKEANLKELLDYKFSTINQLKVLLVQGGYTLSDINNNIKIYKNGEFLKEINPSKIELSDNFSQNRSEQIRALIYKYSKNYSKDFSPIYEKLKGDRNGKIIGYESDLTKFLKASFGLNFVFHFSEAKKPFGYTLIDNKDKSVLKGSEILKLSELIGSQILNKKNRKNHKKLNEVNSFNINSSDVAKALSKHYKIPQQEININRRLLSNNDNTYYKTLLQQYFKNNNWSDLDKLNIYPVVVNDSLYLIDKLGLNVVPASEVLEKSIMDEFFVNKKTNEQEIFVENDSIGFDWSMRSDVDDEKVHGRERNKKGKER